MSAAVKSFIALNVALPGEVLRLTEKQSKRKTTTSCLSVHHKSYCPMRLWSNKQFCQML